MHKTISVYFSGTTFSIQDSRFLTSDLYQKTEESESQIKMGFNGCGINYGLLGIIFGTGLDAQCDQVLKRVLAELNAGHQITLNVYGHSRGAVAALLLAKQLGQIDKEQLSIHLALLDPVPGNLISSAALDPFKLSLANKVRDLRACKPLKKVLALYPYKPLPAIACHAPLLVSYPQETEVSEEVINGCHAEAEQCAQAASQLVRLRVEEFLVDQGTALQTDRDYTDKEAMKERYLTQYEGELSKVKKKSLRSTHSTEGKRITAKTGAQYFNKHHKALLDDYSNEAVALSIESPKSLFAKLNLFLKSRPLLDQAFKWTLLSFSLAALVFFTGGLAAIPFLATLGSLSILVVAPLLGAALAGLWYGAIKPFFSWCVGKLYYPHYAMRRLTIAEQPITSSTRKLMDGLGAETSQTKAATLDAMPYQATSPLQTSIERTELEYNEIQAANLQLT